MPDQRDSFVQTDCPLSSNPSDIASITFSSTDDIIDFGTPTVTRPEPERTAEWADRAAAPVLPAEPAIIKV